MVKFSVQPGFIVQTPQGEGESPDASKTNHRLVTLQTHEINVQGPFCANATVVIPQYDLSGPLVSPAPTLIVSAFFRWP
jgi:hypothetical protein